MLLGRNHKVFSFVVKELKVCVVSDIVGVGDLECVTCLQDHCVRFETAILVGQFVHLVLGWNLGEFRATAACVDKYKDVRDTLVVFVDD